MKELFLSLRPHLDFQNVRIGGAAEINLSLIVFQDTEKEPSTYTQLVRGSIGILLTETDGTERS